MKGEPLHGFFEVLGPGIVLTGTKMPTNLAIPDPSAPLQMMGRMHIAPPKPNGGEIAISEVTIHACAILKPTHEDGPTA